MLYRNDFVKHLDFSMMNNPSNKSELRQRLIAARRALTSDARAQADARIAAQLMQWLERHQIKVLGGYLAIAGEPDLSALYAELPARGITLAMPVVLEREQPLVFVRWQAGDALAKDASGTMAPVARGEYLQPDAVLAPCVGFTADNLRLGFGGGYFDRTLAQTPRPKAVGIAYAFAKVEFAAEAHDVPLDAIITN
jgi:5-formyltetrahydrofolate cyclo-ligase